MNTTAETLADLEALRDRVKEGCLSHGCVYEELRKLQLDYLDLHTGAWAATGERAAGCFLEHFSRAASEAAEAGHFEYMTELEGLAARVMDELGQPAATEEGVRRRNQRRALEWVSMPPTMP